ncbi:MAG: molybdopterin-guanine dinucleotide biosynthesis protein B [Methylovulum sp.]|nr:molybdopterin-guanine dinucleotide biosynthesis protein B [Methylovulum sp.]
MQHALIPILGFAAASGTGKTTLLTALIPLLKQRGLRIGLIKHSHHSFQIDQPGKDSFRLREAGASPVMLVSTHRRAIITEIEPEREPRLDDELQHFGQAGLDLILVEGFKAERFPKIELHRQSLQQALLYPGDPDIIAVASDSLLAVPDHVTLLDINQPEMIAGFILARFITVEPTGAEWAVAMATPPPVGGSA